MLISPCSHGASRTYDWSHLAASGASINLLVGVHYFRGYISFGPNFKSLLRDLETERFRLKYWVEARGLDDAITTGIATNQRLGPGDDRYRYAMGLWHKSSGSLEIFKPCMQNMELKWIQMSPLNYPPAPRPRRLHL